MFSGGGLADNPLGLKASELVALGGWGGRRCECPWCLTSGTLRDFVKVLVDRSFSRKSVVCPGCGKDMHLESVSRTVNMSPEEYSWFLWEHVYINRGYKDVVWGLLKENMASWPKYARDDFWGVWRFIKEFDGERWDAFGHKGDWRTFGRDGVGVWVDDPEPVVVPVGWSRFGGVKDE